MGTKFDNLIHIGHDTVIGRNCLCSQCGGGRLYHYKDSVTIWGGCIINKTLTIGENANIACPYRCGGDLEGGKTYFGAPAKAGIAQRELVWITKDPSVMG